MTLVHRLGRLKRVELGFGGVMLVCKAKELLLASCIRGTCPRNMSTQIMSVDIVAKRPVDTYHCAVTSRANTGPCRKAAMPHSRLYGGRLSRVCPAARNLPRRARRID